ncbi:zinc finger, CCHC-type containing protein [Tanacetum coccineum]
MTLGDYGSLEEKDAFLFDSFEGGLCVTTTMQVLLEDGNSGSNKDKGKGGVRSRHDEYYAGDHILNGMSDSLFDVYTNVESAKELWDSLESKYMAEDSSSKKFLVDAIVVVVEIDLVHDEHFDPIYWGKGGLIALGFGYYNNGMFMLNLNKVPDDSEVLLCLLLHVRDEALDKFKIYRTEVELQQNDLVKILRTDRGGEYYDPVFFQSVGIIHETTAPYTPQQNGVAERKNRALKEMIGVGLLSTQVDKIGKATNGVFKYLRGTMNYGLSYVGYPSVLEGAIIIGSSKKQSCITSSTMESEFCSHLAAEVCKGSRVAKKLESHEIPILDKLKSMWKPELELEHKFHLQRCKIKGAYLCASCSLSRFRSFGLSFLYVHHGIGTQWLVKLSRLNELSSVCRIRMCYSNLQVFQLY